MSILFIRQVETLSVTVVKTHNGYFDLGSSTSSITPSTIHRHITTKFGAIITVSTVVILFLILEMSLIFTSTKIIETASED